MGCGMSTEEKEGKARNEEIENQLKRDRMAQRNEIKMLLLGKSSSAVCPWVLAYLSRYRLLFAHGQTDLPIL
jgi:hypothetical protein